MSEDGSPLRRHREEEIIRLRAELLEERAQRERDANLPMWAVLLICSAFGSMFFIASALFARYVLR